MDTTYKTWGFALQKKVFNKDETKDLSELCKINNAV